MPRVATDSSTTSAVLSSELRTWTQSRRVLVTWVARSMITPGQPVEWKSNVLMSISKAELAEIEAQGQAETDELESRILSKGGGVDSLRGINGIRGRDGTPVLGLENKTGGTQVELE